MVLPDFESPELLMVLRSAMHHLGDKTNVICLLGRSQPRAER